MGVFLFFQPLDPQPRAGPACPGLQLSSPPASASASPGSCREGPGPAQWRWGGSNGRLCLGREAAALPLRPCLRHVVSVPVPRSYGES